jgi:alkylation response protein AidB-like acyl-CoA dehydrogenase
MRIGYTPEQEALESELREYFAELMTPVLVEELTSGGEGGGPQFRAALRKLGRDGWLGIGWPKEFGGQGRTPMEQYIFASEVQRAGFPLPTLTLETVGPTIMRYGNERQKAELVPRILAGEMLIAIGYSEPNAGTDLASLTTRAERDGDEWVINGQKNWITNASIADFYVVFAVTDRENKRISAFVVEKEREGFDPGKLEHKLGIKGSPTGSPSFTDVRVPHENLVGTEGKGLSVALGTLERTRLGAAAQAVGIAQGATDYANEYAKERVAFGKPIFEHQALQFRLAEMATKIEVARQMVHHAAALKDAGRPCLKEAAMGKLFASEMAERVCSEAIQIHGGYGYVADFPVERIYRDVRVCQIYEGTSDVQKMLIARALA